jgi:hypothetical protein
VCVGINAYDVKPLNGCVNDARSWAELLVATFYLPRANVTVLLDGEATKGATRRGTPLARRSPWRADRSGARMTCCDTTSWDSTAPREKGREYGACPHRIRLRGPDVARKRPDVAR